MQREAEEEERHGLALVGLAVTAELLATRRHHEEDQNRARGRSHAAKERRRGTHRVTVTHGAASCAQSPSGHCWVDLGLRLLRFVNSELESDLLVLLVAVSAFERASRAEVLIAGGFGLSKKESVNEFGLWFWHFEDWTQKSRRDYLVVVAMLCIA
ncbi:uncharacterized protein LOC110265614 [Arachis ipaensis]|uniref:uncharacterized protein LOC110265614 n=1 Tax=Arachis ipaensis TaxID=130454 RepID=UPI000A2AF8CA|nr:uncharacterized protein LOC110265614 [Arachis ipaensis]